MPAACGVRIRVRGGTDSLHAVGVTCNFTLEAWGSGKFHFFGTAQNGDILSAKYGIGSVFNFSPGGVGHGDLAERTAQAQSSDNFDHPGSDEWIRNNWPQAFASGMRAQLDVSEDPLDGILTVIGVALIIFLILGGVGGKYEQGSDGSWQKVPDSTPQE